MARLREVSYVVRKLTPLGFAKRVWKEVGDDDVMNMAAAVAFYWLLAIFPFFIFLMTLVPMLPATTLKNAETQIDGWTNANLGEQAAEPILANVHSVMQQPRGGLLSVGVLLTLWAAAKGMGSTMAALDRCYDVTRPRPWIHRVGVAIALTVAMVVVVCAVLVLIPVTTLVIGRVRNDVDRYAASSISTATFLAIDLCRYPIGLALVTCLVSTIYQFGGSVRRRWTLITPGAVFTVFTIFLLAFAFKFYIQRFGAASYAKTYGALAGVMILLFLLYFYALVFLIGAEINSEIDYEVLGSKNDEPKDPLPKLYVKEDLEHFRKQLERRGALK